MNTLLVYHRGGGKSLEYPPNCIYTFKWAVNNGAKAIEYDVAMVKNNNSYNIAVIDPKAIAGKGLDINNLNWQDIQNINLGNKKYGYCKVVTLNKVLNTINQIKVKHQIHIKSKNYQIIQILKNEINSFENITITSFDIQFLEKLKKAIPHIKVGWLVKPTNESGNEGVKDLTKMVSENFGDFSAYSQNELEMISQNATKCNIDTIILCGPRIKTKNHIFHFKQKGFEVGAWGIGTNLDLANKLINFEIDRFTIDNPELLL